MVGLGSMGKFGSIVKEGLDQVIFVAKLFCGLHVTNTYLCSIALSYGPSMLPTISLDNSLLLVEKMTTHFGKFGHGDIVLVRSPENPRKVITKRLTGMEGDSISYLVDPKNSDRFQGDMSGYRETTYMLPMIQDILGLFLMAFLKAEYSGGYGRLKVLEHWGKLIEG
ncbi:Mitochondrial inner membrane protease subunit 1 [Quillaja saponaria]|uniref:Mitochondrial inner membrane protease subunit 1 n=1 Tax=Quillaja saponaria TaxID=32244 RepID=A0AAD7P9D2_QUISA|nr:Mitochondrial inner membrane protease subunit 1 [Quillaja saponaria]